MKSMSTRERLLINAERLMAENGIGATSVRDITEASNANVASINYYFGGKNELLLQLLKARFDQLDADLLAGLEQVEIRSETGAPAVADLASAYTDALANLGRGQEAEQINFTILLIERAAAEQDAILSEAQDYNAPGISKLISLFHKSIPGIEKDQLQSSALIGLMFSASVDYIQAAKQHGDSSIEALAIRNYIAAGVTAYLQTISR